MASGECVVEEELAVPAGGAVRRDLFLVSSSAFSLSSCRYDFWQRRCYCCKSCHECNKWAFEGQLQFPSGWESGFSIAHHSKARKTCIRCRKVNPSCEDTVENCSNSSFPERPSGESLKRAVVNVVVFTIAMKAERLKDVNWKETQHYPRKLCELILKRFKAELPNRPA